VRCRCKRTVGGVAGIRVPSGARAMKRLTAHLNEMARMPGSPGRSPSPYSRALQNVRAQGLARRAGSVAAAPASVSSQGAQ